MKYYIYSNNLQNNGLILENDYDQCDDFYNRINYLVVYREYEISIYYDNENKSTVAVIE